MKPEDWQWPATFHHIEAVHTIPSFYHWIFELFYTDEHLEHNIVLCCVRETKRSTNLWQVTLWYNEVLATDVQSDAVGLYCESDTRILTNDKWHFTIMRLSTLYQSLLQLMCNQRVLHQWHVFTAVIKVKGAIHWLSLLTKARSDHVPLFKSSTTLNVFFARILSNNLCIIYL